MLFFLVRAALVLIIGLLMWRFILARKNNSSSRKTRIKFCILLLIVLSFSSLLPFERQIIKFSSPETAFYYSHMGKKIVYTIDMDTCTYIIHEENPPRGGNYGVTYVTKNNEKWLYQIDNYVDSKSWMLKEGYLLMVHSRTEKDSLMVYYEMSTADAEPHQIVDSMGNTYKCFSTDTGSPEYINWYYYAQVNPDGDGYELIFNRTEHYTFW